MSVVHNRKRRTSDICDGVPNGRGGVAIPLVHVLFSASQPRLS
jgi:hypothetical protein